MPVRSVTLRITGDDRDALAALARVDAARQALTGKPWQIKIGIDGTKAVVSALTGIRERLTNLTAKPWNIVVTTNADEATAKLVDLARTEKDVSAAADDMATGEETAAKATSNLADQAFRATGNLLALAAVQRLALAQGARLLAIEQGRVFAPEQPGPLAIGPGLTRLALPSAERLALPAGAGHGQTVFLNGPSNAFLDSLAGGAAGRGGGGIGGLLGGFFSAVGLSGGKGRGTFGWPAVPLFGGLAAVGSLHLLADGILEVAATLIPATAAMIAFGFAGQDAAMRVYNHFLDLHTVMDATGQAISPMTGAMERLHRAVTPEVFQGLGDAITVMNSKTGVFSILALQAGHALDYLAARATVALTHGGISSFMANAGQDLARWGDAIGNIFGIIGNILHVLPGYANILLTALDGVTHGIEVLTATPVVQWALRAGLAFHGFAVYAGLAATGILALAPLTSRIITGLAGVAKTGIPASTALKDLGTEASTIQKDAGKVTFFDKIKAGLQDILGNTPIVIGRLQGLGSQMLKFNQYGSEAGQSLSRFGKVGIVAGNAVNFLARIPLGAWALGAAAVIGVNMVNALTHVNNATTQWINTLQAGLGHGPVGQLLPSIHSDITAVQSALNNASKSFLIQPAVKEPSGPYNPFTTFWANLKGVFGGAGAAHGWDEMVSVVGIGVSKFGELNAALSQLRQQNAGVTSFVNSIGQAVGGTGRAFGLMATAGITSAQVLNAVQAKAHGNIQPMLILRQQILATAQAYQAMGQRGGILGNDLQMLDAQTTDQYKAIQTLNQGWDTFTANMTSTQNNFDNFALGMKNLTSAATTATSHLGVSTLRIHGLGNAIDGLTKKDLALNQAFTQQVGNANALFDSWRTAGLATNIFTGGVKGAVAELLRFAKGSPEATAQLVGLAQEAGYSGPAAFSSLVKWVGNTHDALEKMKQASDQATIQTGLLSTSMRAQGNMIAGQLVSDINKGTMAYYGVQKAAIAYGDAVARDGAQSQQAHNARAVLIYDIIATGRAAHDTTNEIAAMIAKVLHIPLKKAIQIVETGTGHFEISGGFGGTQTRFQNSKGQSFTHRSAQGQNLAGGGLINEGTTATADDVLARVSRGELVVPTHMVNAGYVDHLRGLLPGFAAGGMRNPLLTGNLAVLSGQAAVDFNNQFIGQMTSSMESAMTSAMRAAMAAATAAFHSGTPAFGSTNAAMRFAQGLLGARGWSGQWPALFRLWMMESGWNAYAVNPTSGAYGIPQALGHGHPFNLGDYANQIRWGLAYIASRYGSPDAALAHELSVGWYDWGGKLKSGWNLALNTTGADEIVVPSGRGVYGGGGGDTIIINVSGDFANPDATALRIQQALKDLKRHRGNHPLGLA